MRVSASGMSSMEGLDQHLSDIQINDHTVHQQTLGFITSTRQNSTEPQTP
jgi:hypothetical protein